MSLSRLSVQDFEALIPPMPPRPYGRLTRISPYDLLDAIQPSPSLFADARPGSMLPPHRLPLRSFLCRRSGRLIYARDPSRRYSLSGGRERRERLLDRDGRRCVWCQTPEDATRLVIDHIIPRCHGGSDEDNNLQVLCADCNLFKKGQFSWEFRRSDFCPYSLTPL